MPSVSTAQIELDKTDSMMQCQILYNPMSTIYTYIIGISHGSYLPCMNTHLDLEIHSQIEFH